MRIDLHCHSTRSDGSRPAIEVAQMAAHRGVELFCLTDHDTWAGHAETVAELPDATVLRGMELSCREYDRTVHVLVYGIDDGAGAQRLRDRLEQIADARRQRLIAICARLAELGHALDVDAIVARSHGRVPGRPDVARALVAAGICTSLREAFDRFLKDGGPADVPIERLSVADGLELARPTGARMSLAHPHTLGSEILVRDLFRRFRDAGLDGLEAFYGSYPKAQTEAWLRTAREFDLVATGGSDYHGPDLTPGVPGPGIEFPDDRADTLRRWLEV